jgi:UDP-2,3-diacylglucosamine pyrophosphatase LpxH
MVAMWSKTDEKNGREAARPHSLSSRGSEFFYFPCNRKERMGADEISNSAAKRAAFYILSFILEDHHALHRAAWSLDSIINLQSI